MRFYQGLLRIYHGKSGTIRNSQPEKSVAVRAFRLDRHRRGGYNLRRNRRGAKGMQELKIGRVYRHFKGDYYLVEGVADHSETGETYVIYRKLYGDGGLWLRPMEMFLSPVDREKYPDVQQEYRFQLQEIESRAEH